jgi:hypothetical protein
MVTTTAKKNTANTDKTAAKRPNGSATAARKTHASPDRKNNGRFRKSTGTELPSWLAAAVSVIGVGVAVGAGLYATRHQWMPKAEGWRDEFSAAFADDETDHENFDQTRGAGAHSMRDHPGDDWDDVDHMSDASFPASDPPSFTPGVA